ncbi:MAG: hypothetical protein KGK16_17335, partial [Bradyrhizobium sp.]|nr:hypothetical protein [Bradyrhizobium sp.]
MSFMVLNYHDLHLTPFRNLPYSHPTNRGRDKRAILPSAGLRDFTMPVRYRHLVVVAALAFLAGSLSGCGTINEKLADGMADYVPQWLGGLPADAPPRP